MHSNKFAVYIFGLFSSSLDALVKLYKTTSSQKQFPSDCIQIASHCIMITHIAVQKWGRNYSVMLSKILYCQTVLFVHV